MTGRAATPSSSGGSVALVTGASRGIGLSIAREISRSRNEVVLVARSSAPLRVAAGGLAQDCRAHVAPTDLVDAEQVARLAQFVAESLGRLDILIHAAGVYDSGPLTAGKSDVMAVNYEGPVRLTTSLLPLLKAAKGQIVFINSTQGLHAGRGVGAYAASKFALRAFADSLRAEVNACGVRVLTVFAGSTATAMQEQIHERAQRPYRPELLMQPADVALMVMSALRLPRSAEVTEMTIRPMHPPVSPV